MTEKTLLRKETITHEKLSDGSICITKVIERKISEDSDRMSKTSEVEILT